MGRTKYAAKTVGVSVCPDCGKRRYATRKIAKTYARSQSMTGVNAYQCGDFWHLGHLPKAVREGQISRDDLGPVQHRGVQTETPVVTSTLQAHSHDGGTDMASEVTQMVKRIKRIGLNVHLGGDHYKVLDADGKVICVFATTPGTNRFKANVETELRRAGYDLNAGPQSQPARKQRYTGVRHADRCRWINVDGNTRLINGRPTTEQMQWEAWEITDAFDFCVMERGHAATEHFGASGEAFKAVPRPTVPQPPAPVPVETSPTTVEAPSLTKEIAVAETTTGVYTPERKEQFRQAREAYQERQRAESENKVMDALRFLGPRASQADVTRYTRMAGSTVRTTVDRMVADGKVREERTGTVGRYLTLADGKYPAATSRPKYDPVQQINKAREDHQEKMRQERERYAFRSVSLAGPDATFPKVAKIAYDRFKMKDGALQSALDRLVEQGEVTIEQRTVPNGTRIVNLTDPSKYRVQVARTEIRQDGSFTMTVPQKSAQAKVVEYPTQATVPVPEATFLMQVLADPSETIKTLDVLIEAAQAEVDKHTATLTRLTNLRAALA